MFSKEFRLFLSRYFAERMLILPGNEKREDFTVALHVLLENMHNKKSIRGICMDSQYRTQCYIEKGSCSRLEILHKRLHRRVNIIDPLIE